MTQTQPAEEGRRLETLLPQFSLDRRITVTVLVATMVVLGVVAHGVTFFALPTRGACQKKAAIITAVQRIAASRKWPAYPSQAALKPLARVKAPTANNCTDAWMV